MRGTRDQILKAAYDLMGNQGLEEVHARTVAQAVQVNHATVHYYFPRREDLLLGVCEYAMGMLASDRAKFHEGAPDARSKVGAEIALAEAYAKKGSRFAKVLAGLVVAGIGSPAVRKKVKELYSAWAQVLAENLGQAKAAKNAVLADPELLAAVLFGLALSNLALEGGTDVGAKLDAVYASLFG